jgi:hypothetical protein
MATTVVDRGALRIGPLLAEGGEGRVFEVAGEPGLLFKAYRTPAPVEPLAALVGWPDTVRARDPELARRVATAAAWPSSVVTDDDGRAAGILLPRAPRRFSLRHRDGTVHLATLSYLTAAPGQRSAAYGLALPPPMSPERLGLVYALARLLEALQAASPAIGHGDLSTKNVLWSLERGPEIFLLDCDSAAAYDTSGPDGAAGDPIDGADRRRAMTPNWDDPAIPPGSNPTLASDRYSLALIFLRVAGAAHFPIQGRQRRGEPLRIDFEVAPVAARARSLDAAAPTWDLCERSLSVADPAARPSAGEWAAALEQVLDDLGAMGTVRAVWAAQGGGEPGPTPPMPSVGAARDGRDVRVVPTVAVARAQHWQRISARPVPRTPTVVPASRPGAPGLLGQPPGAPNPIKAGGMGRRTVSEALAAASAAPPVPVLAPAKEGARRALRAWLAMHARMARTLASPEHHLLGLFRLVGCIAVDIFLAICLGFVVVMIIAPWLKI